MKTIISTMQETHTLSDESILAFKENLTRFELKKKELLIREGKVDRNYYFIEKGLTRSYSIIDGNEVTSWFSKEGDITFSMLSCYLEQPGYENVETLEDSIIYSIPVKVLNQLYEEFIDIANWSRLIHQKAFLDLELRHIAMTSESAESRYNHFKQKHPDLMQRVNLGYIASFLGMTQVTLSRLRSS